MTDRVWVRGCAGLWAGGLLLPLVLYGLRLAPGVTLGPELAPLQIPRWQELTLFFSAYLIKPLYMTLALLSAWLLLRNTAAELIALRRGMFFFFLGEAACAANYLLFHDRSPLLEYWHDYGMLVCFSLLSYALLQAFDARICHYSAADRRCALLPLCGGCYKQGEIPCTLRQLFLWLLPGLMVLAALPLSAIPQDRRAVLLILDRPVLLAHPVSYQLLETRLFPIVAMVLFALAYLLLLWRREGAFAASKLLCAAGCGPLAFSLMRFLCYRGFADQLLWANVWEETTELCFVAGILFVALKVRGAFRNVKGSAR